MCAEPLARGAFAPLPRQIPTTLLPDELFRANLAVIEAAIRYVAGHYRLSADERDEFASEARLRLIDNDYEVLRRFEQRSSLKTYLVTVIQRHYLDLRDKAWGKWRPSAEARRLGPVALRLERLIVRDNVDFGEAVEILRTNHGCTESRDELYAILQKLPVRTTRRLVGEQALDDMEAGGRSDDALMAREQAEARQRVREAIDRAMMGLAAQDRLILKLHYVEQMTVADIARLMHLDQKPLYRRLTKIRQELRRMLEAAGITSAEVLGALPDEPEDPDDPERGPKNGERS
jgi:RNA polymerase sigma factor (sigma-70 family)